MSPSLPFPLSRLGGYRLCPSYIIEIIEIIDPILRSQAQSGPFSVAGEGKK